MTSVVDIRPAVAPLPLPRALEGVSVEALFGPSGEPIALEDAGAVEVRGVTVSSNDCDLDWIFVAIPGLTQHGVRFAHAAKTAGAAVLVTD
ncbi:MAG: UDP-N-acetylmuramoyl-L-alanyl-D-glutamate--2,6-diaminopimelate ligase, partial [Schaalia hyovaginalis]|nr:UDP-N-acetylmuramoyl-L-alanyl-D-glutamate--2,6-diaminopimelate ligase [Schaalia hyovaginalis]